MLQVQGTEDQNEALSPARKHQKPGETLINTSTALLGQTFSGACGGEGLEEAWLVCKHNALVFEPRGTLAACPGKRLGGGEPLRREAEFKSQQTRADLQAR